MARPSLVYGVTVEQIDALGLLLQAISAYGDAIAISGRPMHERSLPTLGEAIFDAAREVRGILDRVGEQRLDRAKPD